MKTFKNICAFMAIAINIASALNFYGELLNIPTGIHFTLGLLLIKEYFALKLTINLNK
jgi:hypothetical protein